MDTTIQLNKRIIELETKMAAMQEELNACDYINIHRHRCDECNDMFAMDVDGYGVLTDDNRRQSRICDRDQACKTKERYIPSLCCHCLYKYKGKEWICSSCKKYQKD